MIAPAAAYVALLVGLPVLMSLFLSVSDARVGSETISFAGLTNFRSALATPAFRVALRNSFLFTAASQALVVAGATLLALALREPFRGRGLLRLLVLLPWVAPISLGAIGWKWLLDSLYSVVTWVLVALSLVSASNPPMWLGEPRLAMLSVLLVHAWRTLPFATMILLAGLSAIPRDIPEAAAVDGSGFWRTHLTITLPMIRPILLVALLFGVVFTFTDMSVVYLLTRGGPYNSTHVLASLAFQDGVLGGDVGRGAAVAIFLVPVLVVLAIFMLRTSRRAEVV